MKRRSFNTQPEAIVVGNSADEFVRYTMNLLGDYEAEYVFCEDVYLAVGRLARYNNPRESVLVIGRIEQLSREEGRFFDIAGEKGFTCCCLAATNSARKQKLLPSATGAGVHIVSNQEQIEETVAKMLRNNRAVTSVKEVNKRAVSFNKDEFLTTKAERDALLGA